MSSEDIELTIMVARAKQDFARGNTSKIPHKSRISKCNQEEKRRFESTARHRVYGDVYWSGPAKLARDQKTGFAHPRDEPERGKFDRDKYRGCHLPKAEGG